MINLNLSSETAETKALAAKIESTKRKIRCMDTIASIIVSTLVVFVAFVIPILIH